LCKKIFNINKLILKYYNIIVILKINKNKIYIFLILSYWNYLPDAKRIQNFLFFIKIIFQMIYSLTEILFKLIKLPYKKFRNNNKIKL